METQMVQQETQAGSTSIQVQPLPAAEATNLLTFIEDAFGPTGKLVASGRSYRSQQHVLALAIAQSFMHARPGMYEGAVGVGKTFAYLASVLWMAHHTGRRTIIAVSTNSLLDQIYKDIPVLLKLLNLQVRYGQLKGRANYVCQDMRDESIYKMNTGRLRLDSNEDFERAERLLEWASDGTDVTHYDDSPPPRVLRLATIDGAGCKERRSSCMYSAAFFCEECREPRHSQECSVDGEMHDVTFVGTRCYFMNNRRRCMEAEIVVTNLNLLLLNHDMEQMIFGKFDYVVLDEAHEVNAKVRDEYTQETALSVFDRAAGDLRKLANTHNSDRLRSAGLDQAQKLEDVANNVRQEMVKYALRRDQASNRSKEIEALLVKGYDSQKLFSLAQDLKREAEVTQQVGQKLGDKGNGEDAAKTDVTAQANAVHEALTFANDNQAVGVVVTDKHDQYTRPKLLTVPVEVGGFIRESILKEGVTVAVSATLTTDGKSWGLPRKQLGMPDDALTCAVDSPFDYAKRCAVYVPSAMPASHMRAEYNVAASNEAAQIVDAMGGKTLILCSARDDIETARKAISELGFEVLTQGSAPPRELARRFKENTSSCLVGSKTFGTGFDVPGEALQCTILWKLPFAKQTLVDEFLKKRDGEGAWRGGHYIPAMLLDLRQWAGRLIRHADDVGIIAILDTTKVAQLKKAVLPALPKGSKLLREIDEIEAFMFNLKMS